MLLAISRSTPRLVAVRSESARADVADAELVRRAAGGDRGAEDALVRRYYEWLLVAVTRLLGDPIESQDVTQDSFATSLRALSTLREPGAYRPWLLQIAVRNVHARFRARRWARFFGMGGAPYENGLAEQASPDATPDQHAELVLLDRVLARIAPADRVAWSLRHVDGMKLEDVADACECSLATAKRRIAAADSIIRAHVSFEGRAPKSRRDSTEGGGA